jgi:hypothetical protein
MAGQVLRLVDNSKHIENLVLAVQANLYPDVRRLATLIQLKK